jgi:general secretion pathway protein G
VTQPQAAANWKGPYWDKKTLPKDPWLYDFIYRVDPQFGFVIRSLGADGKEGGEGDNADIDNRS